MNFVRLMKTFSSTRKWKMSVLFAFQLDFSCCEFLREISFRPTNEFMPLANIEIIFVFLIIYKLSYEFNEINATLLNITHKNWIKMFFLFIQHEFWGNEKNKMKNGKNSKKQENFCVSRSVRKLSFNFLDNLWRDFLHCWEHHHGGCGH